jgi:hypothetical protein
MAEQGDYDGLAQARGRKGELLVFVVRRDTRCGECGEELGSGSWITLANEKGALCLECADLDHLEFLPAGDMALTRRASKYSKLKAVVLRWARARKRYERQGILAEAKAIQQAEEECLSDADLRARRRDKEALRRAGIDEQYVREFGEHIRRQYPGCPAEAAQAIAGHACLKYSDRVGRSSAAKEFDPQAIRLAVGAWVRHNMTPYDELLGSGCERYEAREKVIGAVQEILAEWGQGGAAGEV